MSCALGVRTVVMLFIRLHEQEIAWSDASSWNWSSFLFVLVAKLTPPCINYPLSLYLRCLPPLRVTVATPRFVTTPMKFVRVKNSALSAGRITRALLTLGCTQVATWRCEVTISCYDRFPARAQRTIRSWRWVRSWLGPSAQTTNALIITSA